MDPAHLLYIKRY